MQADRVQALFTRTLTAAKTVFMTIAFPTFPNRRACNHLPGLLCYASQHPLHQPGVGGKLPSGHPCPWVNFTHTETNLALPNAFSNNPEPSRPYL